MRIASSGRQLGTWTRLNARTGINPSGPCCTRGRAARYTSERGASHPEDQTGDFVDRVSGTNAVAGAADFVVMLDRKRHRGIQLGCSSSVRAWSIWSLRVRRGRGHRLTLAGERFVGSGLRGRCGIFHLLFLWTKEALLSVLTAVIPVLLPLREVVPELAYLHRKERVHSKIQPVPYDLCTHSEQERDTLSKRQGDLVPVPCCCRGTEMCN